MASCKDCIHVEVCRYYTNELAKANGIPLKVEEIEGLLECDDCEHFKDRSQFVELPCKGNPILGIDVFHKLEELIKTHHRVEWHVVGNNPVKRHYDKFCKRHNGYIHHFCETTKDEKGNYIDSYTYEIINRRCDNAN